MRIDFSTLNKDEFQVKEFQWHDETLYLVLPQNVGCHWTNDNLIFRSSVWNQYGEPVSLSFFKFFNFNEMPNINPAPTSMKGVSLIEKVDGSTCLVSTYKDQLIVRTRGTIDATQQLNGDEISLLRERYPEAFKPGKDITLIYEWVSPDNVIVIRHSEPDLYLIGCIHHHDYKMETQEQLDELAAVLGVKRPRRFTFKTIKEMLTAVADLEDIEGLCVYYPVNGVPDAGIRKVKTVKYLVLHAFKSQISIKSLLDLYLEWEKPSYTEFIQKITDQFDYECAIAATPICSKILDASKEVAAILNGMRKFVEPLKDLSRKDAAAKILSAYGTTNRSGFAFGVLDNKPLDNNSYKKLIFQIIGEI